LVAPRHLASQIELLLREPSELVGHAIAFGANTELLLQASALAPGRFVSQAYVLRSELADLSTKRLDSLLCRPLLSPRHR